MIKGHATAQDIADGRICLRDALGNHTADVLANAGADAGAPSAEAVLEVMRADQDARALYKRVIAIGKEMIKAQPPDGVALKPVKPIPTPRPNIPIYQLIHETQHQMYQDTDQGAWRCARCLLSCHNKTLRAFLNCGPCPPSGVTQVISFGASAVHALQ